ncbi:nicotinate-nucleotide pyrophosphorylase [Sphingomonas sp. SORGH_AS 950]|nr:nicotinate-nucleotide pyrophosphorylase [Sphingomonas sp. SORGH_AS_0950]
MIEGFDLDGFVTATLAEDMGPGGDITSAAVIPASARFVGTMASRDAITVAGLPVAEAFFRRLDPPRSRSSGWSRTAPPSRRAPRCSACRARPARC